MNDKKIEIPKMLDNPDFTKVKETVAEYLRVIKEEEGSLNTSDLKHSVFERTMEAMFGKDVWKWYNKLPQF